LAVFRVLAVKVEINIARLNATNLNEVNLSEIESMTETMRKDSNIILLNLHWGLD
jgi:hypothetical protein